MNRAITLLAGFHLMLFSAIASADDTVDPSQACFASIASKPELQTLKDKIALGDSSTQPLEMLASTKKPTKAEKPALSLWVKMLDECKQIGDEWRLKNYPAQLTMLLETHFSNVKILTSDLYAGNISYGDFAKARGAANAKLNSDVATVVQKTLAERKAEQEQRDQQAKEDQRRRQEQAYQTERQNELLRAQDEQARRNAALQLLLNQQRQSAPVFTPIVPYQMPHRTTTNTNCNPNGTGGFNCATN